MSLLTQPIAVGTASANSAHRADLGKFVLASGKVYVVAKATSAIATAGKKGVVSAFSSGAPTWNVGLPADVQGFAIGIIPSGQTGSDGSTGLVAGDYFLLQVGGPFTGLASTTRVKTDLLHPGMAVTSLGYMAVYGCSVALTLVPVMQNTAYVTNTAVCTAGDDQTGVLAGLW